MTKGMVVDDVACFLRKVHEREAASLWIARRVRIHVALTPPALKVQKKDAVRPG